MEKEGLASLCEVDDDGCFCSDGSVWETLGNAIVLLETCKDNSRHVAPGIYVGFLCVNHAVGVLMFWRHACVSMQPLRRNRQSVNNKLHEL